MNNGPLPAQQPAGGARSKKTLTGPAGGPSSTSPTKESAAVRKPLFRLTPLATARSARLLHLNPCKRLHFEHFEVV